MHNKLNEVRDIVEAWCMNNNIYLCSICDTIGLQGLKIYERNKNKINSLLTSLNDIIVSENIFMDIHKVRGGHLLAFSVRALNESDFNNLLRSVEFGDESMDFKDKIGFTFVKPINISKNITMTKSLLDTAMEIVEDSFKDATEGSTRANQTSLQRNRKNSEQRISGVHPKHKHRLKSKQAINNFKNNLNEALEGLATPDNQQPQDLFKKFAKALEVLGTQIGVGPLQDHLKQQGINYKKSKDGQAIILYIINATTNAPQPIARISAETLAKPNDFQKALTNMLDFSQGKAPGAFEQEQEELRAKEKVVRDIAQTVNPTNEVQQMMGTPSQAGVAAATTAATPK